MARVTLFCVYTDALFRDTRGEHSVTANGPDHFESLRLCVSSRV